MRASGGAGLALLLLTMTCGTAGWVDDLLPRLRCGMALSEIRDLTAREIKPTRTQPWLGSYWIDGKRSDVWLEFDEGGLVSAISGTIDGLTSVRLSPKKNLCTGELYFRLRIVLLTRELLGAEVYLDDRRLGQLEDIQTDFELSAGAHELRIQKEGFEPLSKELDLDAEDRGQQRVELGLEGRRLTASLFG